MRTVRARTVRARAVCVRSSGEDNGSEGSESERSENEGSVSKGNVSDGSVSEGGLHVYVAVCVVCTTVRVAVDAVPSTHAHKSAPPNHTTSQPCNLHTHVSSVGPDSC